jgi:hypothetical protein
MNQVYFLVFTARDEQGCIVQGLQALRTYLDSLSHDEAQGYQLFEFIEQYLPLVAESCPDARYFIN